MSYTSSIVNKYGDSENVKQDAQLLRGILSRQGASLLIDAIAEQAGDTANKHHLPEGDRLRIMRSLLDELKSSLEERL